MRVHVFIIDQLQPLRNRRKTDRESPSSVHCPIASQTVGIFHHQSLAGQQVTHIPSRIRHRAGLMIYTLKMALNRNRNYDASRSTAARMRGSGAGMSSFSPPAHHSISIYLVTDIRADTDIKKPPTKSILPLVTSHNAFSTTIPNPPYPWQAGKWPKVPAPYYSGGYRDKLIHYLRQ